MVFINTSPPEDTVQLLKPINNVEMEDDSEDIYPTGLLKRYTKRSASLEHVSLADWAAWYDSCGKPYIKKTHELDIDNLPIETNLTYANDDDEEDKEEPCDQQKQKK